jgi:hypothetical protein
LEDFKGDRENLGTAEKYFEILGKVPDLELRAKALKYFATFEELHENLLEVR